MKLYLISQSENQNYDTFDSAVVCAENAENARLINPDGDWSDNYTGWCSSPDKVKVTEIGTANDNYKQGDIILSSFNAG